jgi:hypothetical protein
MIEGPSRIATPLAWGWAGLIALIALLVLARPMGPFVALAQGIALALGACLPLLWLIGTGAIEIGSSGIPARAPPGFGSLALLGIAIQFAILLVAYYGKGTGLKKTLTDSFLGFVGMIVPGALVSGLAYLSVPATDMAMSYRGWSADSVLTESVAQVQACAHRYASEVPGRGYPRDLVAMGPNGTGCLNVELARGRNRSVQIDYDAAPPEGGTVPSYTVTTRARVGDEKRAKAYGDASGVIRKGEEIEEPRQMRIVHGSLYRINVVRACAEAWRAGSSTGSYPRTIGNLGFPGTLSQQERERLELLGCPFGALQETRPPGTAPVNLLTYRPVGDVDPITDYVVEIRPQTYAVDGTASYRATARGGVHVTFDNRAATDADQIVPHCEYDARDHTCATHPGGRAPDVALSMDTVAAPGIPFRVAVRDRRSADRVDAPYQAGFECGPDPRGRSRRPAFSFALESTCKLDRSPGSGDVGIVRAWVRDRAGSIVILTDTVRLTAPAQ